VDVAGIGEGSVAVTPKPETSRLVRWADNGFLWGGITGAIVGAILLGVIEWVKYIQRFRDRSN
jgi:hypothetical protein